ncbi:MAG: TonB-dependent receptor domain-containing protein [Gammaproteobacteria bacterium]
MNKHFFTLIAFSVFTNFLVAQEEVEEVIVTSSLVDATEITNPLYVIDGETINNSLTTSLGDAIDDYLGISMADYGAAVGQPIIRGMSGPRVKILKNGMVNRDVSGLGVDHLNDVDLHDLEQIEIVKGPSSLLYANGTIGGIINVVDDCITNMDFEMPEFKVGYETQSVNDGSSQYFNYKNNFNGFNVNFGYKETDFGNYDIPNGAIAHEDEHGDDHDEDEDHDEHEMHEEDLGYVNNSDLYVEATKFGISKTGDWGYFGISVDNLESVYGIPFHGDEHGDEEHGDEHDDEEHGDEEHGDERIFSTTDSESTTIKGSYNLNGKLINKIDYSLRDTSYTLTEAHDEEGHDDHGDEDHGDEDHGDEEEHAPTVFKNDALEYGVTFDISNDLATRKIVLNFVDEDNSIVGEEAFMNPANSEEFTIGYYLGKEIGDYNLDLGIRLDQIDRSGSVTDEDHGDVDYYSIDDSTSSFAMSVGRDLNEKLSVNLGYASVERLPSVIELFMNGPHMATGRFEVGDPNLSSETSNNLDITFNYQNGEYYGYASFYITDVDNYIALIDEDEDHDDHGDDDHGDEDHGDEDDHGNLIHANYMQEDAEFDGYEIEFGRTFAVGSGELDLSFGRDVVNAEFSDGHYVPRMNPARNIYSLSYKQDDLLFNLSLKDVEKQNDVGEGETVTDGYQMLNSRLTKTYKMSNDRYLKVTLFGNNLLDEVARNHSSFVKNEVPLPGRNYGLKFNFKY